VKYKIKKEEEENVKMTIKKSTKKREEKF